MAFCNYDLRRLFPMTEAGALLLQTHRRSPFVDVEPLQLSEDINVDICSCHWSGSEDQWWCLWTSWESFEWGRRTNPTNSIFAFAAILIFTYIFGFVNNPDKNSAFSALYEMSDHLEDNQDIFEFDKEVNKDSSFFVWGNIRTFQLCKGKPAHRSYNLI